MNGESDRPISFSVSFCICGRSFKLISFPFVWERETLAAVHSTHDYGFWSNSLHSEFLRTYIKVFKNCLVRVRLHCINRSTEIKF